MRAVPDKKREEKAQQRRFRSPEKHSCRKHQCREKRHAMEKPAVVWRYRGFQHVRKGSAGRNSIRARIFRPPCRRDWSNRLSDHVREEHLLYTRESHPDSTRGLLVNNGEGRPRSGKGIIPAIAMRWEYFELPSCSFRERETRRGARTPSVASSLAKDPSLDVLNRAVLGRALRTMTEQDLDH